VSLAFVGSVLAGCSDDASPVGRDAASSDTNVDNTMDSGADGGTATFDVGNDTEANPDVSPADGSGGPDAVEDDAAIAGEIGSRCSDAQDCFTGDCLFLDAALDFGICSELCATAESCPDEWSCILLRNSGDDAVRWCLPPDLCLDNDNDRYGVGAGCLGPDCNDNDETINPGADEICDGFDQDCDTMVDENPLLSGDACDTGFGGDCTDGRYVCETGLLNCIPLATTSAEVCDSRDNDCDGIVDEDAVCQGEPCCFNDICEGVCATAIIGTVNECIEPTTFGDEICDSRDNDCDGQVDEGLAGDGETCDTGNSGVCAPGVFSCRGGVYACYPDAVASTEVCDTLDNDCDGLVDEGLLRTWYLDNDEDGFGTPRTTVDACSPPEGYVGNDDDCDDTRDFVYTGAPELCDGRDNNCNRVTDEDAGALWYADNDNDEYGDRDSGVRACTKPPGFIAVGGDCNDRNSGIHPGVNELCDGADNDCDGEIDEGVLLNFYPDTDLDGFGNTAALIRACAAPAGAVSAAGDCDDTRDTVYPGANEVCNNRDDNCNSVIDEGVRTTFYPDVDGDLWGRAEEAIQACSAPAGFVISGGDCNDAVDTIYPGADEVCNGISDDCDLQIDEGVLTTFYLDTDNDGFGVVGSQTQSCTRPDGYAPVAGDCNNGDGEIFPGAPEICDTRDNDCDMDVDEDGPTTFYQDLDGDLWGGTVTYVGCAAPPGYVGRTGDCDEDNPDEHPGAMEVCDGRDNNCNVTADEGVELTFYLDRDNDGFGSLAAGSTQACTAPEGYVDNNDDCNDGAIGVNPLAAETPGNGRDDNCDGAEICYVDSDGDGYRTEATIFSPNRTCADDGEAPAMAALDCDDTEESINPDAAEVCGDGIDNNCAGGADEGCE
jgi:hypothetical protein